MRIALRLAYDGTNLGGWQRQPGLRTGQGLLEAALEEIGVAARVQAAGRTDAGVHAEGQVVHLGLESAPDDLARRLVRALPPDLRLRDLAQAPPKFNARWSSRGKVYRYVLVTPDDLAATGGDRFLAERAWRLPDPRAFPELAAAGRPAHLDAAAMRRAMASLLGTRDLRGLATLRGPMPRRRGIRRMGAARLVEAPWPGAGGGRLVVLTVAGTAFLRHQVRNLVGLLAQVGYGEIDAGEVSALVAGRTRHHGPRAPGRGLTLVRVRYPAPLDPFRDGRA